MVATDPVSRVARMLNLIRKTARTSFPVYMFRRRALRYWGRCQHAIGVFNLWHPQLRNEPVNAGFVLQNGRCRRFGVET